jgi:hypothetical protein
VIAPTRSVSDEYLDELERFVAAGGHLLVVDSPDVEGSTASSLLEPFGLAISGLSSSDEPILLRVDRCVAQPPMLAANAIRGGEPIARWGDQTVAARTRYGAGSVTAVGFGSLFNDAAMGFHWLPEPDQATLERYEVLYALLSAALPPSLRRAEP